jgi:hypothetical protein
MISISDEVNNADIPQVIDIDGRFKPHLDTLLGLVKRMPNPTSLLIIAAITLLMQILITMRLLNLLDIDSTLRMVLFWLGLILWLAGGIYIAWRIPAWRIKHFIEEKFELTARHLITQLNTAYHELQKSLASHLNAKNLASEKALVSVLSKKLHLACKCYEKEASQERTEYPYPEIPMEKVRPSSTPFLKYLESEAEISAISKRIHKSPEEFVSAIRSEVNSINSLISNECFQEFLELVMREIRGLYADTKFELPKNLEDRIKIAKQGWQGYNDQPLLNIDATTNPGISKFYCACDQGWKEPLGKALEVDYTEATIINLLPKDRIYFFKTFFNIPLDRIHL